MLGFARRLPKSQAPTTNWVQAAVAHDELVAHLHGKNAMPNS
jgi:hypothetical protein